MIFSRFGTLLDVGRSPYCVARLHFPSEMVKIVQCIPGFIQKKKIIIIIVYVYNNYQTWTIVCYSW